MKQRIRDQYKKLRSTNILSNFFNLSSIQFSNILLLFLTIRAIAGNVGLEAYGLITFAYRFAMLIGTVVNYGTTSSGVRDTAYNLTEPKKLSAVFYNSLCIRVLIFLLFLIGLFTFYWFHVSYYLYILLATPVVLAEVFNPLCFFIGAEKLRAFNICNLAANILVLLAIIVFIKSPNEAAWVNFILGMGNVITYAGLLIYFAIRYKLTFSLPLKTELLKIGKNNFYLTVNNISVNLQQSIIIFALKWGDPKLLGAYSICDRVIGQCRNFLIILSNAIYPNAVHTYKQSIILWNVYRRKTKYIIAGMSFTGSILIFILADFIVYILSKQHDETAVLFLRIMAFVPTVSALNVLNVLDQLLKNNTLYIFRIAVILLIISALTAYILSNIGNYLLIGAFTLIIEICALLMYEYAIKKAPLQNV